MTGLKPGTIRDWKRTGRSHEPTDGLPHAQALGVRAAIQAMPLEFRSSLFCEKTKGGVFTFLKPSGRKEIEPTPVCRVDVDGTIHPLTKEWVPQPWLDAHKS